MKVESTYVQKKTCELQFKDLEVGDVFVHCLAFTSSPFIKIKPVPIFDGPPRESLYISDGSLCTTESYSTVYKLDAVLFVDYKE